MRPRSRSSSSLSQFAMGPSGLPGSSLPRAPLVSTLLPPLSHFGPPARNSAFPDGRRWSAEGQIPAAKRARRGLTGGRRGVTLSAFVLLVPAGSGIGESDGMCESNVYLAAVGDVELLLMEDVGWIETDGPRVVLKDLFGTEKVVEGRLKYADLVQHRIVLEPAATQGG